MTFKISKGFIKKIDSLQQHMINSGLIKHTLLEFNSRLSTKYNCNIYLKREDQQIVRSFKIRGAFSKINNLNPYSNIVCASAGNHAQGVAHVCNKFNMNSTIFVPKTTPSQKIERIKYFSNTNCNLEIIGNHFSETLQHALNYSKNTKSVFVHPYDDTQIIEGQSTIATEIFKDIQPDIIMSSVGGGGLISGLGLYGKQKNNCKIIGGEPYYCQSMKKSILENKIININTKETFVDGATVNQVGKKTFEVCKQYVDKIYGINDGEICESLIDLYEKDGIITEPAGALPIAILEKMKYEIKNKNVVVVVSGGNNDISRYPEIQEKYFKYIKKKQYYIDCVCLKILNV